MIEQSPDRYLVAPQHVEHAVGQPGRATGPHLHWGLNWFDVRLDPLLLTGIQSGQ